MAICRARMEAANFRAPKIEERTDKDAAEEQIGGCRGPGRAGPEAARSSARMRILGSRSSTIARETPTMPAAW